MAPSTSRTRPLNLAAHLLVALTLLTSACSSKAPAPSKAAAKRAKVPIATKGQDGKWSIAATGSRFEPPIQIAAVPDKAWYCDMGTVHYAQSQAGDKTCKLCKMKLKHKNGAAQNAGGHQGAEHHGAGHHGADHHGGGHHAHGHDPAGH